MTLCRVRLLASCKSLHRAGHRLHCLWESVAVELRSPEQAAALAASLHANRAALRHVELRCGWLGQKLVCSPQCCEEQPWQDVLAAAALEAPGLTSLTLTAWADCLSAAASPPPPHRLAHLRCLKVISHTGLTLPTQLGSLPALEELCAYQDHPSLTFNGEALGPPTVVLQEGCLPPGLLRLELVLPQPAGPEPFFMMPEAPALTRLCIGSGGRPFQVSGIVRLRSLRSLALLDLRGYAGMVEEAAQLPALESLDLGRTRCGVMGVGTLQWRLCI